MVPEILLAEFRNLGVQVVAADSGTDPTVSDDDPTRKLIRQVPGAAGGYGVTRRPRMARSHSIPAVIARLGKLNAGAA